MERPISLLNEKFLKELFKLKISILYLPVTLIRLMKTIFKEKHKYNLYYYTGSMANPLQSAVGEWFANCFSNGKKAIVNNIIKQKQGLLFVLQDIMKHQRFLLMDQWKPLNKYIKLVKLYKNKKKEIRIQNLWPGCMTNVLNGLIEWKKYWDKENNFRMFDLGTIKKRIFDSR